MVSGLMVVLFQAKLTEIVSDRIMTAFPMTEQMKALFEQGLANGLLGVMGGFARLATGLTPIDSIWAEIFRILAIAMPIAWLCGGIAEEMGWSEYVIRSVSFIGGMLSHNIAKVVMDLGPLEVLKLILGRTK